MKIATKNYFNYNFFYFWFFQIGFGFVKMKKG